MVIRPLQKQDRDDIAHLVQERGTFNDEEIRVAVELLDESLRYPERDDYQILCAVEDPHSLAGYICYGPVPMTQGSYDLYWIVVERTCSRHGVGRKLLEKMEASLVSRGARNVYVETSSTPDYEAARGFYQKHGYRLACVLEDFYRPGDHKMTYVKGLSPVVSGKQEAVEDRSDP